MDRNVAEEEELDGGCTRTLFVSLGKMPDIASKLNMLITAGPLSAIGFRKLLGRKADEGRVGAVGTKQQREAIVPLLDILGARNVPARNKFPGRMTEGDALVIIGRCRDSSDKQLGEAFEHRNADELTAVLTFAIQSFG